MKGYIHKIRNNDFFLLYLLVILTLMIRSIYVLNIYKNDGKTNFGDDFYYLSLGNHFAAGNWVSPQIDGIYPNFIITAPGVPVLVALFIRLFNDPIVPFFIYNIISASLIVPVFYYLGKEIFSKNIGWLLAIWGVLNIEFLKYTPHILKETTVYLFVPLTILFIIKGIKSQSHFKYLIFSVLSFVWLIHTDERYFFYFPIFGLIFLLKKPFDPYKGFRSIILWSSFVLLLMLPWGIRNYKIYGQVVIISPRTTVFTSKVWGKDISGMNFLNNKEKSISSNESIFNDRDGLSKEKDISTAEKKGIDLYLKTFINIWQPTYFKKKYIQYSWWPDARPRLWSTRHNLVSLTFYGVFLPLYLIGLVLLVIKSNLVGLFLGVIPVINSLLHTFMIMPEERYRYPIVFIVVMIGFWAATNLYENAKNICMRISNSNSKPLD